MQSTSIRPRRLAAALAICACSFAMAYAVDHGVTRSWPEWARALWAFTLIGGGIGGVLLALTAAGLVTDASVAGPGDLQGRAPTARTALLVYAGFVMLGAVLSVELERRYGLSSPHVILAFCGLTLLVSSLGRPWWLYATIRRLGWFASIENDTHMRVLLALFGAVLLLAALAGGG